MAVEQYDVSVKGLVCLGQFVASFPPVQNIMLYYSDYFCEFLCLWGLGLSCRWLSGGGGCLLFL